MPKSKSRTKRPPKRVLALPDPRTREDGRPEQPDIRQRPAYLRPRHSRVRHLVLFGAAPRVQPHGRPPVSDSPRTTAVCTCHHQPSARGGSARCVRGCRRWPPEPRTGSGYPSCERGAADRCSSRKLADARAGPPAARLRDTFDGPRVPEHAMIATLIGLRTAPRRAVGPEPRVDPAAGGALGDCRSGRQGRTYANRPDSNLAEERCGRVDGGG